MKKTKFREIELESGSKIILGKDEESNDELMKKYKGKKNTILHTSAPGSPFGVIGTLNPTHLDVAASGAIVASYSQDWRDNKRDVSVDVFTGRDISKNKSMKLGTWKVKKTIKIKVKKEDILRFKNDKS